MYGLDTSTKLTTKIQNASLSATRGIIIYIHRRSLVHWYNAWKCTMCRLGAVCQCAVSVSRDVGA
jgi:hypothetical protein